MGAFLNGLRAALGCIFAGAATAACIESVRTNRAVRKAVDEGQEIKYTVVDSRPNYAKPLRKVAETETETKS